MQRADSGHIIVSPFSQNDGVVWAQFCFTGVRLAFGFYFGLFCGSNIYVSVRFVLVHPLVELFKTLFWFISAQLWLKIMAQFTFRLEH